MPLYVQYRVLQPIKVNGANLHFQTLPVNSCLWGGGGGGQLQLIWSFVLVGPKYLMLHFANCHTRYDRIDSFSFSPQRWCMSYTQLL